MGGPVRAARWPRPLAGPFSSSGFALRGRPGFRPRSPVRPRRKRLPGSPPGPACRMPHAARRRGAPVGCPSGAAVRPRLPRGSALPPVGLPGPVAGLRGWAASWPALLGWCSCHGLAGSGGLPPSSCRAAARLAFLGRWGGLASCSLPAGGLRAWLLLLVYVGVLSDRLVLPVGPCKASSAFLSRFDGWNS